QAEDGIRDFHVTGVQTCALPISAICLHLADLVPEKGLLPPPGTPERGACYRWMSFAGPLEAFLTARHYGSLAPAMQAGYGSEARSEERRVGKECGTRGSPHQ